LAHVLHQLCAERVWTTYFGKIRAEPAGPARRVPDYMPWLTVTEPPVPDWMMFETLLLLA
jgi:hypothetical protein